MCAAALAALRHRGTRVTNQLRLPLELKTFDLVLADLVIALEEASDRPALQARWPQFASTVCYWSVAAEPCSPAPLLKRLDRLVRELFAELTTPGPAQRPLREQRREWAAQSG
jgi:hypothetical protein